MPIDVPTLTTERLVLRPFGESDAQAIWDLHTNANVLKYWDSPPWTDRSRIDRFFERCRTMPEQDDGVRLAVDGHDGTFLGWMHLGSWNQDYRSASFGYCFNEESWGHGYATEAGFAVLGWGLETLDLNRVQAEVDTRHRPSARVLEKLGFVLEGTLREDCVVNGDVSDSWVYGLLRREWAG